MVRAPLACAACRRRIPHRIHRLLPAGPCGGSLPDDRWRAFGDGQGWEAGIETGAHAGREKAWRGAAPGGCEVRLECRWALGGGQCAARRRRGQGRQFNRRVRRGQLGEVRLKAARRLRERQEERLGFSPGFGGHGRRGRQASRRLRGRARSLPARLRGADGGAREAFFRSAAGRFRAVDESPATGRGDRGRLRPPGRSGRVFGQVRPALADSAQAGVDGAAFRGRQPKALRVDSCEVWISQQRPHN